MLSPDLHVPYFEQPAGSQRCGAACAQMILAEIDAGTLDQAALFAEIHDNNFVALPVPPDTPPGAALPPDQQEPAIFHSGSGPRSLTKIMNVHRPAARPGSFTLIDGATKDEFSEQLVKALYAPGVAPVVLVNRQRHWVVVTRCDTDLDPRTSAAFTIRSFDVNNPLRVSTTLEGYIANVAYDYWLRRYLRETTSGSPLYLGRFWAVCETVPLPAATPPAPPIEVEFAAAAGLPANGKAPAYGKEPAKLISPKIAIKQATQGLRDFGLAERPPWRDALQKAQPGEPRLVEELDELGSFYYIVPWANKQKQTVITVNVDATDGAYQESEACLAGSLYLPAALKRNALYELVVGKRFELPNQQGSIFVRPEALSLYPLLVWQPCAESLSPQLPFYLFTVGAHRLYVRLDGKVFTSLNTEVFGF